MRKPRVAFFIDQWAPGSGTENQLQGLLSHLVPDHIEAHLYTLRVPVSPEDRDFIPCPVDCLGIGSLFRPHSLVKFPGIVADLRKGGFDVAMIYFMDSNLYFVPACKMAGIPAIVINRRDMGYWYNPKLLRALNGVNRLATHFLVNAESVRQQVMNHENFSSEKIHIIPNGIWKVNRFATAADPGFVLPLGGFSDSNPLVGITASLREVKRVDRFLDMAKKVVQIVPTARFVIAGRGGYEDELRGQAHELGIEKKVVFLGQVDNVPALLGRLKVGVLTSDSEGLSNSLIEYGLAGVPAVTFAVGGNPEIVTEGETGFLVPPGDTDALADKVIKLLQDSILHDRMSILARQHCERSFSPDRILSLTMEFFTSLMDSQRKG